MSAIRDALEMFRDQKVRFMLTVSGIVVGVASLVVMASVLEVGQAVLRDSSAEASGDDILTVSNDWHQLNDHPDAKRLDHADQVDISSSALLSPENQVTGTYGMEDRPVRFNEKDYRPLTLGVDPEAFGVYRLSVEKGREFGTADYEGARRVILAGCDALDGGLQPGDVVRVQGAPYTVVGILAKKAEMGPGGAWSWNRRLLFPQRTYQLDFDPSRRPTNIVVKVAVPPTYPGLVKDYVIATRTLVDGILQRKRSVKSWEIDGVSDDASTEALIMNTIQALLYMTTLFSMIVGGINIMNIMLVTVVERTREIGLRRALGATQAEILRQFLAETLTITLTGAVIGLVGAVGILGIAAWAMTKWVTVWPFQIEPWSVFLGLGFSSMIGVIFGMYPAWRASRLDPVEALRSQ
ncbi:ABC transporter permease [Deltaproteobacteria bacterium]|nr:ABC transporter permease [Deltaproteobacteria bacterium]